MTKDILNELKPVFCPEAIAVVGASSDSTKSGPDAKSGTQFLRALVRAGYNGPIYPVNPGGGTSQGLVTFTSLRTIPGPVDYVIVAIPRHALLPVLDDCAAKGVKAVQLFTAGFRESGDPAGLSMEKEITEKARRGGFRLIGPNCIGVYNPSMRIPYGPSDRIGEAGSVGFISQSGGHGGRFIELGMERRIAFSKVVSFGNGADLDCVDFLEYFAADPETKIIGAYLESVTRGRRFLDMARRISPAKPVVVWKGGRTGAGAEAATSHTGALASNYAVWRAALAQAGAIVVENLEEMADTIIALEAMGPTAIGRVATACRRVAIASGLGGGGGGESVLGADACIAQGLEVPRFSEETRRSIGAMLPPAGTILRNPLDLGGTLPGLPALEKIMHLVFADQNIDVVMVQEHFGRLLRSLPAEQVRALNEVFIRAGRAQRKPLVVVAPAWAPSPAAVEIEDGLRAAGVAVYRSFETAARSIARTAHYFGNMNSIKGET